MFIENQSINYINQVRSENGYRTIDELLDIGKRNTIYDIFSILISKTVSIGSGNVFYPNVLIKGETTIGDSNTLFSGTNIQAIKGIVKIGSGNEIGENIAEIKASNGKVNITDQCRIMNNAHIMDGCYLGKGSQVLGNIKISNCYLCDGESYKERNPNNRGGVIKGFGTGNNLKIATGMVINGNGIMKMEMLERQEKYHSNWREVEPT